jgi:hypothetical protein
MTKYHLAIEITYTLEGEVLEEYLDQLQGNEDTESQRKEFLIDRFASPWWKEQIDEDAELVYRKLD